MCPWTRSIVKKIFDKSAALLGIIVLSPLFLIVALLIKLDDGGAVFFRQERVGYKGKPFWIWKFRTMVVGAERLGMPLTVGRDSRITRVGYWLRRLKLDELPQLWNVLRGEMSLVGPRPEVPCYVKEYSPEQRKVLELIPGITDPASIHYIHESDLLVQSSDPELMYREEIMPKKIRINLEYAKRASFCTDIFVIFQTLGRILR